MMSQSINNSSANCTCKCTCSNTNTTILNTVLSIEYTANDYKCGKKMIGNDGSVWIVSKTSAGKQWVKFVNPGFTNLSEDYYNYAYFPNSEKLLDNETGLESKFGGNVPFFIKGETWPMYNDIPMVFFCQFQDPRKKDNKLYRVFFPIDNEQLDDFMDAECINHVSVIELNEQNIANKIICEKPKDESGESLYLTTFPPYKILSWNESKELKSYETVIEKLNISSKCKSLKEYSYDEYALNEYAPSFDVKIGGTPTYCQSNRATDDKNPSLLQLTDCKEMPYGWGDSGIAHIRENLAVDFDCC